MTKYIFVGLGLGLAGFLVILLAVAVFKPNNSGVAQSPIQVDQAAVLGTEQKNIAPTSTPTPYVYNTPTPIVEKVYKYGEKVALKDGRFITVFAPIVDYKGEEGEFIPQPRAGQKHVLVEAIYENQGTKKTACNIKLRIADQSDSFYDNDLSFKQPAIDCRNHEDQSYLQPGKSTRGFTNFSIDQKSEVRKVVYQDYEHEEKITFAEN